MLALRGVEFRLRPTANPWDAWHANEAGWMMVAVCTPRPGDPIEMLIGPYGVLEMRMQDGETSGQAHARLQRAGSMIEILKWVTEAARESVNAEQDA